QITMRVLPSDPPTMQDLNVEEEIIDAWSPRQGIVIITGPTGSGKTTLLAAGNRMLLERPRGCGKMLTYESPIEYVYDNIHSPRSLVSQSEIPRH
ncbi:Flp pilus assembly complex ATPase component, partial [bacterium LRH843]|nr:Flp pilus assembly complex ATPase component [bacterium LRH843]